MAQTLILDATTKTIKVKMSGAPATTNPDFVASWADNDGTTFTEGSTDGALNGTSDVTLVGAPASSVRRVVKSIAIENKDTSAVTITVMYDNNATQRNVAVITLAVGDTWTTDGTYDTNGQFKTVSAGGAGDMVLADVQSVTGLKTFDTTKLAMKGSSTGTTAIASANAGASNYTATLQAATGTLAYTADIPSLTGYVNTTGTPANNQLAIFTDADTVEGDSSLTYDGTSFNLATAKNFQIAGSTVLADAAGTTTLQNIDALDATTEATIEGAIDTLANLTSIQGRTVTLADAGANAIFGWDDAASAYENLTQGEVRAVAGLATTDSPEFTAVNIGHASDTTITKVSAGLIAVEGVEVVLASRTATRTLVLTSGGGWPSTTAGCATNAKVETTTNDMNYYVLDFDAATDENAEWTVIMPDSYTGGTITAQFYWTAASSSGDVIWAIKGRAFANDDALDQAFGTAVTVTDTLTATGDLCITSATGACTLAGSPAGGQMVSFKVYRDADAGGDTLAADARLMAVKIEYPINSYTD